MAEINKLVRDRIPNIIARSGKHVTYHALSEEELKVELRRKAIEEATELANAETEAEIIEEIADLRTILDAVIALYDIKSDDVFNLRNEKLMKKGDFSEGYWLEKVED